MIIKELNLKNFGKYNNKSISLSSGLNIIYGDNESGKTTVHSFIRGMFLGIEKPRGRESKEELYSRFLPWDTPTLYSGSMVVQIEDREYQIYRNFYKDTKELKVVDLQSGRAMPAEIGKIPSLFKGLTKENYRNTLSIEQNKASTDKELAMALRNYMANLSTSQSDEVDVDGALRILRMKKKRIESNDYKERLQALAEKIEEIPYLEDKVTSLSNQLKEQVNSTEKIGNVDTQPDRRIRKLPYMVFGAIISLSLIVIYSIWQGSFSIKFLKIYGVVILLIQLASLMVFYKRRGKKQMEFLEQQDQWNNRNYQYQRKLERMEWEVEQLEERLNQLESLRTEYTEIREKKQSCEKEVKALDLAIGTIQELSRNIHDNFGVKLAEDISEKINKETNGKYSQVFIDENLNMKVRHENAVLPIEGLSTGTIEQFYLALRLAAGDLLLREKEMPVILDETFVFYDEKRLESALDVLLCQNRQIILFTCHKREQELLEGKGTRYHYIEL